MIEQLNFFPFFSFFVQYSNIICCYGNVTKICSKNYENSMFFAKYYLFLFLPFDVFSVGDCVLLRLYLLSSFGSTEDGPGLFREGALKLAKT